jgi:exopolysaccharide biosynthesis WecB/TagA/CpsF family protein
MSTTLRTKNFLGLDFVDATYEEVAAELVRLEAAPGISLLVTPNVSHVVMLGGLDESDAVTEQFKSAYDAAAFRLCDSRVLRVLAWMRGVTLKVITGSDLTALLFEGGYFNGRKVALIGGDPDMSRELRARFPEVDLSQHIPPMGILENEPAIVRIEEFLEQDKWHYILFAIGAPRSEIIAHRLMSSGSVQGVAMCIGASIEFLLGRKARAPHWMQVAGLEWLFRLLSEPRRLWRRYLVKSPRILSIVSRWEP